MSEWNKCKHEWAEPIDSPCEDDVYCVKCGCDSPEDWWTLFNNEGADRCDPCELIGRANLRSK